MLVDSVGPRNGQHLLLARDVVDEFSARTGSVFCWICAVTCYYRKHSYDEFQVYRDFRVLGGSRIVRPAWPSP
jgi:hypothetical protein